MAYLARKISRAKWDRGDGMAASAIPADAVTADLRTAGNKLSMWRCNTESAADINDVILALAARFQRVGKCDVVWVDEDALLADGQVCEESPGETAVADLVDRHVDVVQLDYVRLGRVAGHIAQSIAARRVRRATAREVVDLLADAVRDGRVDAGALHDQVGDAVGRRLRVPRR